MTMFPGQDFASGYLGARAEALAAQFVAEHLHVIGLQETRTRMAGHSFSSAVSCSFWPSDLHVDKVAFSCGCANPFPHLVAPLILTRQISVSYMPLRDVCWYGGRIRVVNFFS